MFKKITETERWEELDDMVAKKEYERTMGISSVDVGSRRALQKLVITNFKKKTPGYSLKKNQLKKIYDCNK
jgi:hypothetical protein